MFKHLFGSAARANRAIANSLYDRIVAAARQPEYYSGLGVPDTPLGRFEMLSLHMFLFLHRMRGERGPAAALAQEVTDMFFQDVDHSLRELGIGDIGIPKRMKKLARMFYGRAASYGAALDTGDQEALAAALARNVCPQLDDWSGAAALAVEVEAMHARLGAQGVDDILKGKLEFAAGRPGGSA